MLDESAAQPFFRRAFEAGINFFDTADMYSLGVERGGHRPRRCASSGGCEEIVLATKVYFPMATGPNMGGLSRKHIVQGCEASLQAPRRRRRSTSTRSTASTRGARSTRRSPRSTSSCSQGKVRYIGASSGPA